MKWNARSTARSARECCASCLKASRFDARVEGLLPSAHVFLTVRTNSRMLELQEKGSTSAALESTESAEHIPCVAV